MPRLKYPQIINKIGINKEKCDLRTTSNHQKSCPKKSGMGWFIKIRGQDPTHIYPKGDRG
jgi:hypothetical protein